MSDGHIELRGTEFTVHAREKITTGEYENAEYHTTIEGEISHGGRLENDHRDELKARLLSLHRDAQETVERAASNRIAVDEHEDWAVRCDDGEDGDGAA